MPNPLDLIVRSFAAPILQRAGFQRRGREFRLQHASGDWGLIVFHADGNLDGLSRFVIKPSIGPIPRIRFVEFIAGRMPSDRPGPESMYQLTGIPGRGDFKERFGGWQFDPDTQTESCGVAVAEVLEAEVVPLIQRLIVRKNLLAAVKSGEDLGGNLHPGTRLVNEIQCLLDWAPIDEIESLLNRARDEVGEESYFPRFDEFVKGELSSRVLADASGGESPLAGEGAGN